MNTRELEHLVSQTFDKHFKNNGSRRVGVAYGHIVHLFQLIKHTQDRGIDVFDHVGSENALEIANRAFNAQGAFESLLRAMYTHACVFLDRFVSEICQKQLTLNQFLTNESLPKPVDIKCISDAYKMVTYRNKLIVHSYVTVDFATSKPAGADWRLSPTNVFSGDGITESDGAIIREIAIRNVDCDVRLAEEKNLRSLIEILFETIPYSVNPTFQNGTAPSNDCQQLARLIQIHGCRSMSPEEILAVTQRFVAAICAAFRM